MRLFAFFSFLWNSVVCFFRRIFVGMSKDVVNAIDLPSARSSLRENDFKSRRRKFNIKQVPMTPELYGLVRANHRH